MEYLAEMITSRRDRNVSSPIDNEVSASHSKPRRCNLYLAEKESQLHFRIRCQKCCDYLAGFKILSRNKRILIFPQILTIFRPREVLRCGLRGLNLAM